MGQERRGETYDAVPSLEWACRVEALVRVQWFIGSDGTIKFCLSTTFGNHYWTLGKVRKPFVQELDILGGGRR
jgi:hypothetical protein